MKKNCWEVRGCEKCTTVLGDDACPVCKETKLHGVHGGVNAGRACWVIPHTRCGESKQGYFSSKYIKCMECEFYNLVKAEEKGSFQFSAVMLSKLGEIIL